MKLKYARCLVEMDWKVWPHLSKIKITVKILFLHEINEDKKESDFDNLSFREELELQASTVNKTIIARNPVLQPGDSFNDVQHVIVQDETKCRKKQKKVSFFKNKFTDLKKLFKK
ncbi:hypothetical protein AVEN_79633-1 [Araneus ventricosus]|uniref:Uncharacterized protein n=1 Tax=Araneus ventricosus TaxID=182803 RepID=A0A4Y2G6H8_ARAVE|nr:hypothetical protein AVEN_79633-1 [Araneus ventricosus]